MLIEKVSIVCCVPSQAEGPEEQSGQPYEYVLHLTAAGDGGEALHSTTTWTETTSWTELTAAAGTLVGQRMATDGADIGRLADAAVADILYGAQRDVLRSKIGEGLQSLAAADGKAEGGEPDFRSMLPHIYRFASYPRAAVEIDETTPVVRIEQAHAIRCDGNRKRGRFDYLLHLTLSGPDGMSSKVVHGWQADTGWDALEKAAARLVGRAWPLDPEQAMQGITNAVRAAVKVGWPRSEARKLSTMLGGVTVDAIEGRMGGEPDLKPLLGRAYHIARFPRARTEINDTTPAVRIEQAQALRCDGKREQRRYDYLLHLTLSGPDGMSSKIVHGWQADTGWDALEKTASRLVGRAWPLAPEQAMHGIANAVRAAVRAGFRKAEARKLSMMLGAATTDAIEGRMSGGGSMNYASILQQVDRYVCFPEPPLPEWNGKPLNVYKGITYMHPLGGNGTKGHLLERQALAYGLDTLRFNKGTFVASDGVGTPLAFKWSRSPISSGVSLALCTHKEATRACLGRAGIPVPKGRMFKNGDFEPAFKYAERIGYPVVCKPAAGVRGIGVVANIQSEEELREAFRQMVNSRLGGDDFIVEKHVNGRDYRIIVIDGEVIAAILREPASVVGNGRHNIAELVMRKNAVRRLNPHLWPRPVKYGDAMEYQLTRAGMDLDSVPADGQTVMLSNSCSLSQGGDSIDVLDELHPTIRQSAVDAVAAIPGLRYCGVDYLIEDHTRPIDEQEAGICELNAHAAIGNCEFPMFGSPREVAATFFRRCAETYGVKTAEQPAERLALRLRIRGKVTKVGYREWLRGQAQKYGVSGWRNVGPRMVEAVLEGDTAPVTALAASTVLGPAKALPTSVSTNHVAPTDAKGFRIRSSLKEGLKDGLKQGKSNVG
jgi:D-alanine-D-alanine ligase-like ATP-grasp enzyme/acylphosphatase